VIGVDTQCVHWHLADRVVTRRHTVLRRRRAYNLTLVLLIKDKPSSANLQCICAIFYVNLMLLMLFIAVDTIDTRVVSCWLVGCRRSCTLDKRLNQLRCCLARGLDGFHVSRWGRFYGKTHDLWENTCHVS